MRKVKQPVIYSEILKNSQGEPLPIKLTKAEQYHADYTQRLVNERFSNVIGYEASITTLTQVVKRVSEAKYYEVAPADFVPIKVGEGTWASNLTTFRSFDIADEFESGIINTGGANTRVSIGDTGVDALNIKINNWNKGCGWSIFDLEMASRSGNWDLVAAKEKTRKRNWDLGIQRVAFLGARGQNAAGGSCLGLANQPTGQFDATSITTKLSLMTPTQLASFQQGIIGKYRANCNYTAWPTHLVIPESDYNGLAVQSAPAFPIKSVLALLEEAFQVITRNKNFKILPLAYFDYANGGGSLNPAVTTCQYMLYNYDEDSLVMNVPLQYTNTLANSIDNFMFQNTGYGQFTGLLAIRPAELYTMGF